VIGKTDETSVKLYPTARHHIPKAVFFIIITKFPFGNAVQAFSVGNNSSTLLSIKEKRMTYVRERDVVKNKRKNRRKRKYWGKNRRIIWMGDGRERDKERERE